MKEKIPGQQPSQKEPPDPQQKSTAENLIFSGAEQNDPITQLGEQNEVRSQEEKPRLRRRRVLTAEESREALRKIIPEKFLPKQ